MNMSDESGQKTPVPVPAATATAHPETFTSADHLAQLTNLRSRLSQKLIGLDTLVERLLVALLTGGHLLIEGPPGVAKTRTVNQFAQLLDMSFVRVQATPDLLPADLTGTDMFEQNTGTFSFMPGPLFNHIILIDEVNRAPPKVQSALLEAMGEQQITTGGVTRRLQAPFLVAATQNPIEHEGTYPLPEAQLDRFMFFINLDLPGLENERRILDQVLSEHTSGCADPALAPIGNIVSIMQARQSVEEIHVSAAVRDYIVRLVGATRGHGLAGKTAKSITQAASPRASIYLAMAARARAWLDGRDHTTPDDIAALAPDILSGRIALDYRAQAAGTTARQLVQEIIAATPQV